jgi:hypothetical protein
LRKEKTDLIKQNLQGSNDRVQHSESLGSWTWNSKYLEKTTFLKINLFPSSDERRETTTLLDPLGRANFNHCMETDPFSETLYYLVI